MKVLTVAGARPQFIKAAIVSRALAAQPGLDERLVHTGQHYDRQLSDVFFEELDIPLPAHSLGVGSASHGRQTGRMLEKIEEVLESEAPDCVLVYGDTNSTLAGALAAVKLHIPVAHVESGLRSFQLRMPEEVNRVLTDRISSWLFCPTQTAADNLRAEGITQGVHLVGDVMYDCAMHFARLAEGRSDSLAPFEVTSKEFVLMTCHRAENTDDPTRLAAIMKAAAGIARGLPIVLPLHPRTRVALERCGAALPDCLAVGRTHEADSDCRLSRPPGIRICEPLSYLQMLALERHAAVVLTDSGGVQKEAFFFGTPCVTMRRETEWTETLVGRANILADADTGRIVAAVREQLHRDEAVPDAARHYGGGKAAARIAERLAAS